MPPLSTMYQQQAASSPVPGQVTPINQLTLDEALKIAEKQSPLLEGAVAQSEGATAGVTTARAYPNPSANYWAGPQFARPILTPGVPGLLQHWDVSQPIDLPQVRGSRIRAAELGRDSSQEGLRGTKLFLRSAVKHAFYEVLHRKEEIQHAEEALGLVQDLRRRTEVQVNVGEAARLELTRAEAEIATAQTVVRSARLEYASAISTLRATLGVPLGQNVELLGQLDQPQNLPSIDEMRQDMTAHHPALVQARLEVQRAEAIIRNQRGLRLPQPALYGEYEQQPDLRFYRLGVSVTLPLWDRRKGPIAEAEAAMRQAEALEKQRRLELTSELERAYSQYEIADQQVKSFEAGALRQATAALDAAQSAYKFGERGIIEVLDAQRVLQRIRGEFLAAQYEREAALVDLEQLGVINLGGKK